MRINRLDLARYGHFTDHSFEFAAPVTGLPDFHIIYGPNETGKSTTLAAILDLLFGIEVRSKYGFLHPYPTMRIGAELEIGGSPHQFVRIKQRQNDLLDGTEKPILDGVMLGSLGNVDRAAYTTMFCLDDDSLEGGGESILKSEGDLGQLLFSASTGLSDLSNKLDDLKAEADRFYKFRARGGTLFDLKSDLNHQKAKSDALDTGASEYAKLAEQRKAATEQYEAATAKQGKNKSQLEDCRRQLQALPRLVELRELRERVSQLAKIPDAPDSWSNEISQALKTDIEIDTRGEGIATEIERITSELDQIVVDETALQHKVRIEGLAELRARYVTAAKDIPERRRQGSEVDLKVSGILARIERETETEPKRLLLSISTTGALRDLIEKHAGIEAQVQIAKSELNEAKARHKKAEAKLRAAGGDEALPTSSSLPQIIAQVEQARADDWKARLRLATRDLQDQRDRLARANATLLPWQGDPDELGRINVPDTDQIESWKSSITRTEKRLDHLTAEIDRCVAEERRLSVENAGTDEITTGKSDNEAAMSRAARERAWAAHRQKLDNASAEEFEAALRHDDIATTGRIGKAAETARLHQKNQARRVLAADLAAARIAHNAATTDLEGIHQDIASSLVAMDPALPKNWSLATLETWLAERALTLEICAAVTRAERDCDAAQQDGERIRENLKSAATSAGLTIDPEARVEDLLSDLQQLIDRENEYKGLRTETDERQADLETRQERARTCEETNQAWTENWAKLCQSCWLADGDTIPPVATVREILKALEELGPSLEKRANLAERINKMEIDQAAFAAEAIALANALGLDVKKEPLETAAPIAAALERAIRARTNRVAAAKRLNSAKARAGDIEDENKIHNLHKSQMTMHFGVGSLSEVEARLRDLEKREELEKQVATATREILDALNVKSIDIAEKILDGLDRSQVDARIGELDARIQDQDRQLRELFNARDMACRRLDEVGGDDAVARLGEQRRTTLLEIEDGAAHYLRLRLGVLAAEAALRLYRDQHRSSMMARASEAFRTISREAYEGLTTQPGKNGDILVAVGANGGSKIASELSKGTRFQLYLALRVAGYHEFVGSRQPVPFIADDIMETFDDFRAEEAFGLFAKMAEVGQVIYLTHHQHLCQIAQKVCPTVQVHELGGRRP